MSFTHPAVLWALPLGLVPLLLHLLSRRRAQRREFSDLTLLRRVHAQALPRDRLRRWLLAATRCGVVGALVLAYAGPVLQAGGGTPAQEGSADGLDLVLLLDCSYSMGVVDRGRTRWAAARSAAGELLRSLRPADRVACAAFTDRLEGGGGRLSWTTPRACQELFDRSPAGLRTTDYGPALRAASGLLADSRRERAVLLLGDGAAHGWRAGAAPPETAAPLYALSWPRAPFNAAVLSAGPARGSSPDRPALRVALWASAAAASSVDLWEGRARLASSSASLRAAQPSEFALPLPAAPAGAAPAWSGRAALRPDALSADDSFYFSFQHPRRPRLLVLSGNPAFLKAPQAGYFLQELLGGAKGRLLEVDADFAGLERLASGDLLSGYDAVALADFKSVPAPAAAALESFVRRGGGLWVLPGRGTDAGSFAPLAPWLPAAVAPPLSVAGPAAEPARGLQLQRPGPPFDSWGRFELDKVSLLRPLALEARANAAVVLRTSGGEPLLVVGGHGRGRVAVWGAPLDAAGGNLPVKPVFAALVSAVVSLLREPAPPVESFAKSVGEPIVRVWAPGEAAPLSVRVRTPEGRTDTLWVKDRRLEYGLTNSPGLYAVTDDGGGRRVYAVNLDRSSRESDLSPSDPAPWQGLDPDRLREEFWLKVRGRDARFAALAAAGALLLVEMALALPRALMVLLLLAGLAAPAPAQQGDRFVWTQLKLGPGWDPYPEAPAPIEEALASATSVLVQPQRRVITLRDPLLYASPLLVLAGREAPPPLAGEDSRRLRAYLAAGGMLWIEDTSGLAVSSFDRWVRRTLREADPESPLEVLGPDHVLFRTFFLLRGAAGRVMVRGTLEGLSWGGRTAVVYSRNDLLGAWAKDPLGRPLLPCLPGGEAQRHEARKLTLNILMYSLTGSYKADAVHQPFLLQKMRSGAP